MPGTLNGTTQPVQSSLYVVAFPGISSGIPVIPNIVLMCLLITESTRYKIYTYMTGQ